MKKELWICFESSDDFIAKECKLYEILMTSKGENRVVIYTRKKRNVKRLPLDKSVHITDEIIQKLTEFIGEENVKVVEKEEDYFHEEVEEKEQLERVADALENIEFFLSNIDDSLQYLTECIAYIPPRYHQERGYHFLRIGGEVASE